MALRGPNLDLMDFAPARLPAVVDQASEQPLSALARRLWACIDLVQQTREIWDHRPFIERGAPWEGRWPELAAWLRALSFEEIDHWEQTHVIDDDTPLSPWIAAVHAVTAWLEPAPDASMSGQEGELWRGVKERKRQQILAFRRRLRQAGLSQVETLTDWCGGKGHLSRALAHGADLHSHVWDYDPALLECAEAMALRDSVSVRTTLCDLSREPVQLTPGAGVVALHACGCLTDNALRSAVDSRADWVAVVPCCHHKTTGDGWTAMSQLAQWSGLQLTRNGLRLSISDEVRDCPKARTRRRRRMLWRIGADLLLRDVAGTRGWMDLEMLPKEAMSGSFAAYCGAALAAYGHTLPDRWDHRLHLARATEATRVGRALSLLRGVLRPALEMVCVLDRAVWLQEQRWQVSLVRLCPAKLSPRHLMIVGQRPRN